MSFMFNPYPYHDPKAFTAVDSLGVELAQAAHGNLPSAARLADTAETALKSRQAYVVAIDGYTTAPLDVFRTLVEQQLSFRGIAVSSLCTDELYQEEAVLTPQLTANNLPEDREQDPVLLYGKLFEGSYEDIMEAEKLSAAVKRIQEFKVNGQGVLLISGSGALCHTLRGLCDRSVYLDTTPMQAMLSVKGGHYKNIATKTALTFKAMARRCYYVDFELSVKQRFDLLHNGLIDDYVIANDSSNMTLLPIKLLNEIFSKALCYPLRCKPVYLEGVWGGYSIMQRRNLPKEMKNCAWVFDLIPMEVSLVLDFDGLKLEFPFYTLVQSHGDKLMGARSVDQFGYYFPIRFNYDDTYHATGNMSIQCHPDGQYVKEQNGELGRQDESYYIVEAGQGAKTYLGWETGANVEQFIADARSSEKNGTPVDYKKYVHAVDSIPGTQVMIPAGTIHASGRNQLILEIGSLTIGSYTYKMYDYLRKDFDGKPRPIHTYHGDKVLNRSCTADWVEANLVNGGSRVIRSGEGWEEFVVGENDLLYFSLRNIKFTDCVSDDTKGDFHVLALVDGEQVLIRSKSDHSHSFVQNYLDIVVIPASFGAYEIINLKPGTTVIEHKTMLK